MRVLPKNSRFFLLCTLYFVLCTFSSCRPKGVLSARQMQDVLYDLHYTEAVLQTSGYNYGHDEAVGKYYYEVLHRHGVTQAQFDSSLVWYTDHPERFNKIYPKVLKRMDDQIALMEKEFEQGNQDRQRGRQSLSAPAIPWAVWSADVLERMMHGLPFKWGYDTPKVTVEVPFFEKNAENY